MAIKTKSREKHVSLTIPVALTAELAARVIASLTDWDEQEKAFVAPPWAGTRTATMRYVGEAIRAHGVRYYETGDWREQRDQAENTAALRVARRVVKRLFHEL